MTLFPQIEIETGSDRLAAWEREAALRLLERLQMPTNFPCFFSQNACRRGRILFAFVGGLEAEDLARGSAALSAYVERSRGWDGDVATAEPLAMIFHPETVAADSVEAYHEIGWRVLQSWHDRDGTPWPSEVSRLPSSPFWTMCFAGLQLFVNMSNPAHRIRRSRNLGPSLAFIINPRERFDIVAGDNPRGHAVRERLRRRIHAYDGLPHSPALGSYEAGDIEWWQYGLAETNALPAGTCPFKMRSKP